MKNKINRDFTHFLVWFFCRWTNLMQGGKCCDLHYLKFLYEILTGYVIYTLALFKIKELHFYLMYFVQVSLKWINYFLTKSLLGGILSTGTWGKFRTKLTFPCNSHLEKPTNKTMNI